MQADDLPARPVGRVRRAIWPRRWRSRIALGFICLLVIAAAALWLSRERIASDVIDDYLARNGVPATYDIAAITPQIQVIENLVVGDPARPDLTARRVVVEIGVGWAGPQARRISVDGARLYASYRGGTFSLGALDPLVFTGSTQPPALPAIDLVLTDARALIASDFGAVGAAFEGAGRLDDGFAGTLAATAPGIGIAGCRAGGATLYGKLSTKDGAPRLAGPLRLRSLACNGAAMARADIGTLISLRRDFAGAQGDFRVEGKGLAFEGLRGAALGGTAQFALSDTGMVLAHDLALADVTAPQGRLARLSAEGTWRGGATAGRGQWEGQLRGTGIAPGAGLDAALAQAQAGLAGTLLDPLIGKARGGIVRALDRASFTADAIIRHKPGDIALILPQAALLSRTGVPVVALSRVNAGIGNGGLTALRGNILTGGEGLPSINGRMEQIGSDGWALRLAMADYAAGSNRLAIPRLMLRQERGGTLRFEGLVSASGALPGGMIKDLALPLEGSWSAGRGLIAGTRCLPLRFGALSVSGLALAGHAITLCPESGAPMLAYRAGLKLAARSGPVSLAGRLGDAPARFAADALVLRYPEPFVVAGLTARIGAQGSEARLSAASLTGSLARDIGGAFASGTARLDAVPLDLDGLAGRWAFADGALRIEDGAFILTDRPAGGSLARFAPLAVRGASLRLIDNGITADATLRHPASGIALANVAILHDLGSGAGGARLTVPGVTFGKSLQPEDLSYLAKGVIAFADGAVTGDGRIDWTADTITSSGAFASDGLSFAAAFGPVRGLKGRVVFADLLALTTAPDQRLTIDAINPGIEVLAGTVQFEVKDGTLLTLEEATFPFMGGMLRMQPLAMDFSRPEERRYVFEIIGLDAATFVAEMELTNLAATGVFDGTVPIIFDADGNGRIEGGLLLSRAGGGNVAYIGELTYEDLGTMGNYAFEALRSLDYRQMSVGLNGSLAGEIITNLDFDGVQQGAGTSQNFITRRLAKLPIRFKVNVRSQNFYELATMVRSFWDVDFLGSPVDRGLLKAEDGRFVPASRPALVSKPVQPPESEDQP